MIESVICSGDVSIKSNEKSISIKRNFPFRGIIDNIFILIFFLGSRYFKRIFSNDF